MAEQVSPIGNPGAASPARPLAPVERVLLYQPEREWTYSHHPHLCRFRGRYLAMWSNGREHEDDVGQRVLWASSRDFATWTPPRPLLDSLPGRYAEVVLTAAGFHDAGERLVAYAGQFEYAPDRLHEGRRLPGDRGHVGTTLRALVSGDGEHWGPLLDLGVPIVPNHGPQATRSGRLLLSGNISFPWTDDPAGLTGWRPAGIYPPDMAAELFDDSAGFWLVKERQGWPCGLCEGSFYQTDDGVLHMLLRSGTERLWVTESADDGESWSPPVATGFTDNGTKFHFGRLPDGRFYYVGCPDPQPRGARCPLVLSLSEDGVLFDRHWVLADGTTPYRQRRPGLHKGGEYGYPHTLLADGYLCAIVSRQKEGVEVLRTPVPGE